MEPMDTVTEVLSKLKEEGYTVDFNLDNNCIVCHGNSLQLHHNEYTVDASYRFEGISDPGDEAVVYAISSAKHRIRGILVDGYGIYSDNAVWEMVRGLKEKASAGSANQAPLAST
ncbi:phosphoribosylpyrophosphate synthetase [Rufibacter latericius]|uniref:Phosphoribosylpyrophosphate synthetase n=1 Tax=Rufibacter latericius TaxID=2487040 RepID=A0A3M9MF04_9BACT|nr:phosphoribosylpyrophosphate synthetase [Rufibacter latericius]RNI24140.1 phosphoribosylpyrophosphate synthetase [Rufibacter latericius]